MHEKLFPDIMLKQYTDKPIFIFSAGWRSGSTLVQRMVTASGDVLMWGESGGALDCFEEAGRRYAQMLGPGSRKYEHGFGGNGAEEFARFVAAGKRCAHEWIACMNPPEDIIHSAFRGMLEKMYAEPAAKLGYSRWGIKEVRAGIRAALFLREIYRDAKFVFLVRNPLSCLISIKRREWIDRAKTRDPLQHYALHWKKLASEFREADFGRLIRYEDMISSEDSVRSLSEYLDISMPANFVNESKVDWKTANNGELTRLERVRARFILSDEMKKHGYSMKGGS